MSDSNKTPRNVDPDDDLLEFLGGIDEVNDDSGEDFSDFLAKPDVDRIKEAARKPRPPVKDDK